jgi:hypothetical protein
LKVEELVMLVEWKSAGYDRMGDPYGEEEAVEELQESYLQQRYGLNVHEPGEDTTNTNSA